MEIFSQKSMAYGVITVILIVIVLFSIMSGMSEPMEDAANDMSNTNDCYKYTDASNLPLRYDSSVSTTNCTNSSDGPMGKVAFYRLPLASLFSASGIIYILVMVGVLIIVAALVFKLRKR